MPNLSRILANAKSPSLSDLRAAGDAAVTTSRADAEYWESLLNVSQAFTEAMTDLAKAALPYRDTDPRLAAALDNLEAKTAALCKGERDTATGIVFTRSRRPPVFEAGAIEAEGTIDGHPFFFTARGYSWGMSIADAFDAEPLMIGFDDTSGGAYNGPWQGRSRDTQREMEECISKAAAAYRTGVRQHPWLT